MAGNFPEIDAPATPFVYTPLMFCKT